MMVSYDFVGDLDPIELDYIDTEDYNSATLTTAQKRQLDAAYRILSTIFESDPDVMIDSMRELLHNMKEEEKEEKKKRKEMNNNSMRTEDEVRARITELSEVRDWLCDILYTKRTEKEKRKVRQAIASTILYLDVLKFTLGEDKKYA